MNIKTPAISTKKLDELNLALAIRDEKALRALVKSGLDVNQLYAIDYPKKTPLLYAISIGDTDLVKLLIKMKVDVNVKDQDGWSPLRYAIEMNDVESFDLLIQKGADVKYRDEEGHNMIHFIVKNWEICSNTISKKSAHMFNQALETLGPEALLEQNAQDNTILHMVANRLAPDAAKKIFSQNVDFKRLINTKNKEGFTPLHEVIRRISYDGQIEMMQILLENGADPCLRTAMKNPYTLEQIARHWESDEKVMNFIKEVTLAHREKKALERLTASSKTKINIGKKPSVSRPRKVL